MCCKIFIKGIGHFFRLILRKIKFFYASWHGIVRKVVASFLVEFRVPPLFSTFVFKTPLLWLTFASYSWRGRLHHANFPTLLLVCINHSMAHVLWWEWKECQRGNHKSVILLRDIRLRSFHNFPQHETPRSMRNRMFPNIFVNPTLNSTLTFFRPICCLHIRPCGIWSSQASLGVEKKLCWSKSKSIAADSFSWGLRPSAKTQWSGDQSCRKQKHVSLEAL